jgi:hypothetical protein
MIVTDRCALLNIMQYSCPLFIRPLLIGRTYHDFCIEFLSLSINCSRIAIFNPLLIEFVRMHNRTRNETSFIVYDRTKSIDRLPRIQVFPNDYIRLCIHSFLSNNQTMTNIDCQEFHMITILSSMNHLYWPLFIVVFHFVLLMFAMVVSQSNHWRKRFSSSMFLQCSIHEMFVVNRNLRLFLRRTTRRQYQRRHMNEKKQVLQAIDSIARDCQLYKQTFIIRHEHVNEAYV